MEQQWCDLELGASRELHGLKDAEQALSNELDQMQRTPDTEQFLLTYQLLSDKIGTGTLLWYSSLVPILHLFCRCLQKFPG